MSATIDLQRIDEWDLGDMVDFEEHSGMSFDQLVASASASQRSGQAIGFSMRAMAVMVWIMRRKDDPAFTLSDAMRVKPSEMAATLNPTPRPLEPLGNGVTPALPADD